MKRAAVAALLVAATGCGGAHVLARDETPRLQPGEGLVAFVVQTNAELHLTWCRGPGACMDVPTLTEVEPVSVVVVPAGRWCMTRIVAGLAEDGLGIDHTLPSNESPCFDVTAGAVTYPGDFVFTAHDADGHVTQGWEQDETGARATLARRYPRLASMQVRTSWAHRPATAGGEN